jgi:hypothetical protein
MLFSTKLDAAKDNTCGSKRCVKEKIVAVIVFLLICRMRIKKLYSVDGIITKLPHM